MAQSKESPVHDFYRDNPEFFKIVYNELVNKANELEDNIIIEDIEFKEELYRKNIEKEEIKISNIHGIGDEKNANN